MEFGTDELFGVKEKSKDYQDVKIGLVKGQISYPEHFEEWDEDLISMFKEGDNSNFAAE